MNTSTRLSARRVTRLVQQAHLRLEDGQEPASEDVWIGISVASLVCQAVALEGPPVVDLTPLRIPDLATARECLLEVQREMNTWDWDEFDATELRGGCQMVLDVAELVQVL